MQLSEEESIEIEELFKQFDRNGDQCITYDDLGVLMRKYGQNPSNKVLKEMIAELASGDRVHCSFFQF
jgi:Ca2+-binding EF-hand superfamily protein